MQDVQMNSKTRHCKLYMVISWRRRVGDVCKIIHRLHGYYKNNFAHSSGVPFVSVQNLVFVHTHNCMMKSAESVIHEAPGYTLCVSS